MSTVSISTAMRIALMILFLLAIFQILGFLDAVVAMYPDNIWPGGEVWRLLTYPIGRSFGGLLIGAIAFSQPGEEIESMLGKPRFGLLLLIMTLVISLLHLLFFFGQPGPRLAGPQNLALFTMAGYVYLYPASSVRVIFFNVRSKILLLIMVIFAVAATAYEVSRGESALVFMGEGGAGLLFGILWFHLTYQKYPILLGPLRVLSGAGKPKPQEKRGKAASPRMSAPAGRREQVELPRRQISDEERLDAILEQISKNGYESLSSEDRRFLDDYSSRL